MDCGLVVDWSKVEVVHYSGKVFLLRADKVGLEVVKALVTAGLVTIRVRTF